MNRKELYTNILSTILSEHPDLVINNDDVQNELDVNGLEDALILLKTNLQEENFKVIVESMIANCNEDELNNYEKYLVTRETFQLLSQKRNFVWNSSELIVLNCDNFLKGEEYKDSTMLAFEKICFDENSRKDFLNYIINNDGKNEYYIIYDRNILNGVDSWKLYMYGLYMCINSGGHIEVDPALNYSPLQFSTTISFNSTAKYEQYIDIFDVISEWNSCKDVLTAFLKMYQILEYMVYRKEFVSIVTGANVKQSFVRQIKGLDKKFSNAERDTFVKGLPEVISSFYGEVSDTLVTPDVVAFCTKYYQKNSNGNTYMKPENIRDSAQINSRISKFIYDVRCSLVHNKESEFHITTINYDEYASIVPLMRKIMEVVGKKIMETINDTGNRICFPYRELRLY